MRNKIKQLMNKEEGFTLVELLAVIVILGIIVAIAIPAIGGVIDRAGSNANSAEESLVVEAARLYVVAENVDFDTNPHEVEVTVLKSLGYLEDRDETDGLTGKVTITETAAPSEDEGGATYTYVYER